jgi:hypothetical protein
MTAGRDTSRDVVTWKCHQDIFGHLLNGVHRYLLRFERGQEPPTCGFWSLTIYGRLAMPVDNPARRCAIGDRDPLMIDDDGVLEIYIQRDVPVGMSNWLPAPAGAFFLELSIYSPLVARIERGWEPPAVRRVTARRLR